MIKLDAYNISFMLMDAWRIFAMKSSGAGEKLSQVPVYVKKNGELVEVLDVTCIDGKIVLETEQCHHVHVQANRVMINFAPVL